MKNNLKYMIATALLCFLVSCTTSTVENTSDSKATTTTVEQISNSEEISTVSYDEDDIKDFKEKEVELNTKDSKIVKIILNSDNTEIDDDGVKISNQVITIKKSGNYEFTGKLSDGQIIVDTDDKKDVQIILNNVTITNTKGSVIVVENAKQTVINLDEGSKNVLTDGKTYESEEEDAANATIYSRDDLVINGNGSLEINANYNDGITSKDDLFLSSGNITITAKDDGVRGKDYILIDGANIIILAQDDAIKSDNEESGTFVMNSGNLEISAGDDAIHSKMYLVVNGGTINITKSYEGLESKEITLNGGNINITSSDDGINVTSGSSEAETGGRGMGGGGGFGQAEEGLYLRINGGDIVINAQGDGLDSNGDVVMTGGNVIVYGPTNGGNGALDYNGNFDISGGELIAIGSSGMAEAPSTSSSQNSALIGIEESGKAGDRIAIINSSGESIFNITAKKTYQSIVISSSKLIKGFSFTLLINSKEIETFEIIDTVTKIGETGRNGGMGGFRGGGRR